MSRQRAVAVVFCAMAMCLAAQTSVWAVEAGVAKSSETEQLGVLVPYVPTPHEVVKVMLDMADVRSTDVVFDLGCGDGRIVVAAAKRGARAYGVDIDPARVKEARELAKQEGVEEKATIMMDDIFKTDFSSATVVTMYLLPRYNNRLRPKLERVLPVGARVVSHDFDMRAWKPVETRELTDTDGEPHTVYLWKITPEMKARVGKAKKAPGAKKARRKAAEPVTQP